MILTESNYHSVEANKEYIGSSQYRDFVGTVGRVGCEAQALAKINGNMQEEKTTALLVGSYVDAHFSNTLDVFKAKNPDIFKKDGSLKSDYLKANNIIARIERDKFFMQTLSGGTQKIETAEFAGLKWKIKIDSYHEDVAIVDLKTTKSITETYYIKDLGRISFVEFWGYDIQSAIYQKVIELKTGKQLPCLLACASKENEPDIEIIGFDQKHLDDEIKKIELNAQRIKSLKAGEIEPDRCNVCDYCKSTKVLTNPIHFSKLTESI